MSPEEIRNIYAANGERIGEESNAREALIKKATSANWIRIRHYIRPNYWSIQFSGYTRQEHDIVALVQHLQSKQLLYSDEIIKLTDFTDEAASQEISAENFMKPYLTANRPFQGSAITNITDFRAFLDME